MGDGLAGPAHLQMLASLQKDIRRTMFTHVHIHNTQEIRMTTNIDRRQWLQWGAGALASAHLGLHAQSAWPTKSLNVVVPFPQAEAPMHLHARLRRNLPR